MLAPILLANIFSGYKDNGVQTRASLNRTGPRTLLPTLKRIIDTDTISGSFKYYEDSEIAIWYVFGVTPEFSLLHDLSIYGTHLFIIFPDTFFGKNEEELRAKFEDLINFVRSIVYKYPSESVFVKDLMKEDFSEDLKIYVDANIYRILGKTSRTSFSVIEDVFMKYDEYTSSMKNNKFW